MALINLRNALMAGRRLPYDAEVEYLHFNGTLSRRQYIETGIKVADPASVKFEVNSDAILPFGFTHNNSTTGTWVGVYNSTAVIVYYKNYSTGQSITPPSSIDAYIYDGGSGFYINGSQYASFVASVGTDSITDKSWRFGEVYDFKNAGGQTNSLFNRSGKLYRLKIYVNNILVRDFIPVRKGTVGYLYDRVSGALFGNAGTGAFVLGPDVVPVEYIESHGTEYIDTGVIASTDLRISLDFKPVTPYSGEQRAFGVRSGIVYNYGYGGQYSAVNFFDMGSNRISLGAAPSDDWHNFSINGTDVYFDGVPKGSGSSLSGTVSCYLFAWNRNPILYGSMMVRALNIESIANSSRLRSFRPIRVGSGTTWEGAMMDVLTRRIYRNAGTGAFTYGNDLKYPIPAS